MTVSTNQNLSTLQICDALEAIFRDQMFELYGFMSSVNTSGNVSWKLLFNEEDNYHDCRVIEILAEAITGDLLRAYAYEYVAPDVRQGGLRVSQINRLNRHTIQFNRFVVTNNTDDGSTKVFDLLDMWTTINNLQSLGDDRDGRDAKLFEDLTALREHFITQGLQPVEREGVSASVRGYCAVGIVG